MKVSPSSLSGLPARAVHPHHWLWEPLETDPGFVLRSMFGTKAVYLDGNLMLCFCARSEPWRGVLVGTDATRHAALQAEFSDLVLHPILPKWLYLPETSDQFEQTAARLVALVRRRDPRIGVPSRPKKRKKNGSLTGRPESTRSRPARQIRTSGKSRGRSPSP